MRKRFAVCGAAAALVVALFSLFIPAGLRAQPATSPTTPPTPSGIRDIMPNVWLGMTLPAFLRARPKAEEFSLDQLDEHPKRPPLITRTSALIVEDLKNASFNNAVYFFNNKALRQIHLVNAVREGYDETLVRLAVTDLLKRFGRPDFFGVTALSRFEINGNPHSPSLIWTRPNQTIFAQFSYPPMAEPVRGVKEGGVGVTLLPVRWPQAQSELPLFVLPNADDETRILAPLRTLINELQPGPTIKLPKPSLLPKPLPRSTLSPPNTTPRATAKH